MRVVDDPVHALDDLRVDLLTRELARLAGHRQVLVMTHDARLEEYLRARVAEMTVVALERDAQERTVTWSAGTPWDALLGDAREIRGNAVVETWPYPESVESLVAGLCRAAVDGALRQTVITRAVRRGESTDQALAALERKNETRSRIKRVVELAGGPGTLPALDHVRAAHLGSWNQGSHGQLPAGVDPEVTIDAAEAACRELVTHRWSS